ncbi:ABC transporter substrate-binding protein [Salinibacterium sp. NG22]|uniref:ABC transporter substrate-binding protein n=1 Tax=Salinibacterium sp. NG22 TaxID=2792040 RepID=UPI0018CE4F46|nr:ABC transporter substrate-binding protein [Salinibacterium sp. NG22]MBH0110554.1 ABC transporter substrate-binding protein [Salinibacterium sp. NG22]
MLNTPSRRTMRLVTSGAAALAITAGLVACSAEESTTASGGEPVSGGTLTFASNGDTDCLDPHQSAADLAALYSRPILDSLVSLTDDGEVHPWLAKSWTVSDDQLTYTFELRDDVTFTNGEKFDAAAVKANFDHIVDPTTASALSAGYIAPFVAATVLDDYTVSVEFSSPFSAFLPSVATAYFGMEAPETLLQDPGELCKVIVGTGPFMSETGYVAQQGITYLKNPDYNWAPETANHQGAAYLDELVMTIVPEDSVRLGSLSSGEVDAIASIPPVNVEALEADSNLYTDSAAAPGGNYNYFPNTEMGVFADIDVREAFRIGIDFDTLVGSVYFGAFEPANSPIAPNTAYYDPSQESSYEYDADAAAKLLDDAGWVMGADGVRVKDGEKLAIQMPMISGAREQRDTLAQQVQAEAAKLGFEMVIESQDLGSYVEALGSGSYDLIEISWQRSSPDVLRTLFDSANIPDGGFNTAFSRYTSPVIDDSLSDALATLDPDELTDLYGTAQQEIADQVLVFPQYVFSYILGASNSAQGIEWEPQAFPIFYDAWKSE